MSMGQVGLFYLVRREDSDNLANADPVLRVDRERTAFLGRREKPDSAFRTAQCRA
jgi:hypothetical protein